MKPGDISRRVVWYGLASLAAAFIYFYALESQHIPRNGDELPYAHITRLTASSGHLLPLHRHKCRPCQCQAQVLRFQLVHPQRGS